MLRTTASRSIASSLAVPRGPRSTHVATIFQTSRLVARVSTTSLQRPQLAVKPFQKAVTTITLRQATTGSTPTTVWTINEKEEAEFGKKKIAAHPDIVSATSSIHPVMGEVGGMPKQEADIDMTAALKSDMSTIRETFDLSGAPKGAYYMGLAGVLPYLATSMGTVACAAEINHAHTFGTGYVLTQSTAESFLQVLEPLQVGYGAVILSFLGAIHWGLEFAGYSGYHGYRRYAIGVLAPAIAWPTLLLPTTYALISQFCAFTLMYYTDARATARGWTPAWYSTYRFVLTFIVGSSIVVSLIGHGEIADKVSRMQSPTDRIGKGKDLDQEFIDDEKMRAVRYAALEQDKNDDSDDESEGESDDSAESSDDKKSSDDGDDEKASDDGDDDKNKDSSKDDK